MQSTFLQKIITATQSGINTHTRKNQFYSVN